MIPWLFRPAVLTTGRSRLFSGLAPLVSSLKSLTLASRRPAEVGLYFLIAIAIFRLVCVCVAYPNRHSIFRNPRIPDQFQIGLKEVNLILWMQSNDCLLPVFCAAEPELVPTRLSFSDLRRNSGYPHFKKLLNSVFDVCFRSQRIDFESVLIQFRRLIHRLFGDGRLQDDLMRFQNQLLGKRRFSISLGNYFAHR